MITYLKLKHEHDIFEANEGLFWDIYTHAEHLKEWILHKK